MNEKDNSSYTDKTACTGDKDQLPIFSRGTAVDKTMLTISILCGAVVLLRVLWSLIIDGLADLLEIPEIFGADLGGSIIQLRTLADHYWFTRIAFICFCAGIIAFLLWANRTGEIERWKTWWKTSPAVAREIEDLKRHKKVFLFLLLASLLAVTALIIFCFA